MLANYEVQIRCKRVEASRGLDKFAIERGQELANRVAHLRDIIFTNAAIDCLWCAWLGNGFAIEGNLHPAILAIDCRKSIRRRAVGPLPDVDGKFVGREWLNSDGRLKPEEYLPLDHEGNLDLAQKLRCPRTRCDDKLLTEISSARRRDFYFAIERDFPLAHGLVEAQRRARTLRHGEMGHHRTFAENHASSFLEYANGCIRKSEERKASTNFARTQHFMRQSMLARTANCAGHDFRILSAHHQAARQQKQLLAGIAFEFTPKFIRTQQQRHIGWVLEVRLANHARAAVTRTAIVRRRELFQSENTLPALREMTRRRAAHSAEAEHDDVVVLAHFPSGDSFKSSCCRWPVTFLSTPLGGCSFANWSSSFTSFFSR